MSGEEGVAALVNTDDVALAVELHIGVFSDDRGSKEGGLGMNTGSFAANDVADLREFAAYGRGGLSTSFANACGSAKCSSSPLAALV